MDNVCVPLYDIGKNVTGKPTTAVIGKRFVKLTTNAGKGQPFNIGPATAALTPRLAVAAVGHEDFTAHMSAADQDKAWDDFRAATYPDLATPKG